MTNSNDLLKVICEKCNKEFDKSNDPNFIANFLSHIEEYHPSMLRYGTNILNGQIKKTEDNKLKYHNLFLITAPSGAGKSTIGRKVFDQNELKSFTTRKQRQKEVHGVDYFFITKEEFEEKNKNGELAETTYYDGNHYGITMEELQNKLTKSDCFAVVDYNGMTQLRNIYPHCITIFIMSSKEDCELNMLDRGDSILSVKKRLSTYYDEIANRVKYDYVIPNKRGKLNSTEQIIRSIVNAEKQ